MTARDPKASAHPAAEIVELIGKGGAPSTPPPRETARPSPITPADDEGRAFVIGRRLEALRLAAKTIPRGFVWAQYGNPDLAARVPAHAIELAQKGQPSMVMSGLTGSGKTTLACAILHEVLREGWRAAHASARMSHEARELFRRAKGIQFVTAYHLAKAQMYTPLGRMPEVVEQALGASVLVIDDLGMDFEVYKTSASAVLEVLHERHAEERRTIVTTNLGPHQLEERYGAAIARRLKEWRSIDMGSSKR